MPKTPIEILRWFMETGQLDYIRDGMDRNTSNPDTHKAQQEFDEYYQAAQEALVGSV
jgi:hypothetical protein